MQHEDGVLSSRVLRLRPQERAAEPEGVPTSEEHRLAWAAHRWICGDEEGPLAGPNSGQLYRDIKKLGEGPGVGGQ